MAAETSAVDRVRMSEQAVVPRFITSTFSTNKRFVSITGAQVFAWNAIAIIPRS